MSSNFANVHLDLNPLALGTGLAHCNIKGRLKAWTWPLNGRYKHCIDIELDIFTARVNVKTREEKEAEEEYIFEKWFLNNDPSRENRNIHERISRIKTKYPKIFGCEWILFLLLKYC